MEDKAFTPSKTQTSGKAVASLVCGLLSFCFSILAAIPSLILGLLAIKEIRQSNGLLRGTGLAISGILLSLLGIAATVVVFLLLLIPAIQAARNAALVARSSNNLKQIGLGLHNYHDMFKSFPLAGSEDKSLGIGLSWRVRLLPYMEQQALYERFDFNQPWDSPQNKALISQMPAIYQAPGVTLEPGKTVYLAVLGAFPGEGEGWEQRRTLFNAGGRGVGISHVTDGTANTVAVIEADPSEAAIWTRPDDWEFDPQSPRRGLGGLRKNGFTALFTDGSVSVAPNTISDNDLRRLFTIQDNQRFEAFVPPYLRNRGY